MGNMQVNCGMWERYRAQVQDTDIALPVNSLGTMHQETTSLEIPGNNFLLDLYKSQGVTFLALKEP